MDVWHVVYKLFTVMTDVLGVHTGSSLPSSRWKSVSYGVFKPSDSRPL